MAARPGRRTRQAVRDFQEQLGFGGMPIRSITTDSDGIMVEGYVTDAAGDLIIDWATNEPVTWIHTFELEEET